MQITKELFTIPYRGRTLLYAPLEGSVLDIQPGVISFLQKVNGGEDPNAINSALAESLRKCNILVEKCADIQNRPNVRDYAPTSVTLLPTYNCNFRCLYCYSRGGEEIGRVMSEDIAKASIDFIIKNAKEKNQKRVSLGFHGGGEPLLSANMDLIKSAVEYLKHQAEKNSVEYSVSSASNGVFSDDIFQWATNNLSHLGLSLDGPEDIQNRQRPMAGGKPSFQRVMDTIGKLEALPDEIKKRFNYGLRATITSESVQRMPEILEFFASISKNKNFHLEPLFECGRCHTSNIASPDSEIFLENIVKTSELASRIGREIYYSGASIERIGETFCGACGSNFFVTPEGYVTLCVEACRPNEPIADVFTIGRYNPETKEFEFNDERRQVMAQRKVSKIDYCSDCFAKYNCAGDCPAKVFEQGRDINDPSNNWRCSINRGLLAHRLAERLDMEKAKTLKIETKQE